MSPLLREGYTTILMPSPTDRPILNTRDGGRVLDLDGRDRVGDTHPAESER